MTVIWHNPRCSKSRQTLDLVTERDPKVEIKTYLTDPPSESEIRNALALLGISASGIMRVKDKLFKELGLTPDTSDEALIAAMVDHPALIERPIVFANGKAAIGRPPENVLGIL